MRGRKPKPTALKLIEGNPGQRPLNQNEPKPKPVAPKPPTWMSKGAKKIWKEYAPKLERLNLLTEVDGMAFANLCQEQDDTIRRQKVLNEHGDTMEYTNTKGETNTITRPEALLVHKGRQIIKAYCAEFGLTVSARGRIQLPGQTDQGDEMEQLLRKKR